MENEVGRTPVLEGVTGLRVRTGLDRPLPDPANKTTVLPVTCEFHIGN